MPLCWKYSIYIILLSTWLLYTLYAVKARLDVAHSLHLNKKTTNSVVADSIILVPNARDGNALTEYKDSLVVNFTLPRRLSAIADSQCPDGFWNDDELMWNNSKTNQSRITKFEQFVKAKEWNSKKLDDQPVFVTAASSNHFQEIMELFNNFNDLRQRFSRVWVLYFFNLGLSKKEEEEVRIMCNCSVRTFHFDQYPNHVKNLKGYAFKPLVIQIIARKHKFVVWMDSSTRFKKADINILLDEGKKRGVLVTQAGGTVARRTLPTMFQYFSTHPCRFRNLPELQSGFIILYLNPFVIHRIVWPWIRCALELGCMIPAVNPEIYLKCKTYGNVYGECHRFDQSALGILLYTSYGKHISEHTFHWNNNMYLSFINH
ncbi:hypothetical protein MAR_010611 [Mya arenaria]|uniref:Uncharacterized protein n=1 Tax=Mya arenaria TaxID=6604 RepID=A0ABY7E224_MYAAR|nr:uncharacterized protein LOC128232480 [Mya arenaria]WAR04053.1 hypothetical protein MAR_010611 [Mya arenaria]